MRKLANGWFLPPPLELGLLLALLLFPPQAAPRRANPAMSAPMLSSHVHRWLRVTRYLPLWTSSRVRRSASGASMLPGTPYPVRRRGARVVSQEVTDEAAALRAQILRLGLLDDAVHPVALRRVEDAAVAEPKGDVRRRPLVAVGDEVAGPQLVGRERRSGGLLLVRVARDEEAEPPVGHVDESGAVDAAPGHAAPEVRGAEVGTRLGDRIAVAPSQRLLPHPSRIVVGGDDARPAVPALFHPHCVSAQELGHALRAVVGLDANRRDVGEAELEHGASLALERAFAYR